MEKGEEGGGKDQDPYSGTIEHKRVLTDIPRESEHTMTKKYIMVFGSGIRK